MNRYDAKGFAQWAVVPDIRYWNGDQRRNWAPYVLTGGFSLGHYGAAQSAARMLRAKGIACYPELVGITP
jgi:hypothetical protein